MMANSAIPAWRPALVLAVLPACFAAAALILRAQGGPYWIWHIVDASYFYLFDAINLADLSWPGHPYHPGTPVQVLGALILKALHPGQDLAERVLDDPEGHLNLIGDALVGLEALALFAAGFAAFRVTGNLALALVMEAGPFFSMVILKNAYHAKPEAMLVATMALFCAVTLAALRPDALEGRGRTRFALAWGALAGLGVATKLTAAPVFLLPVFLLKGRGTAVYVLAALCFFALFMLPAAGALGKFAAHAALVMKSSGAHGAGAATVIDVAAYPGAVLKILKRPAANLPVLLALAVVGWAAWRKRRGLTFPSPETRALTGVGLAVLAQVLAVAKQPTANYLIPSYMLLPLAILLAWRIVAATMPERPRLAAPARAGLVLLIALQGFGVARLSDELDGRRRDALGLDETAFSACARVYFFPASHPAFALLLGDWWTGSRHAGAVAARVPPDVFWFEQNTMTLRDARGPRDLGEIAASYPCLMLRGGHRGPISAYLAAKLPGRAFDTACSSGEETVLTSGTDCRKSAP
ncbi:MAG: hypothetical protein H7841_03725 [Magnetospirillum sp. WYHS-4]